MIEELVRMLQKEYMYIKYYENVDYKEHNYFNFQHY